MRTLLLNPWMAPHTIVSWQRAVVLVVLGKVDVLEEYDEESRSPRLSLRAPAVVRLKKGRAAPKQVVRFNRFNVYARDAYRCQYCGERKAARDLNQDHVIPRMKGGPTTWENIVTSCYPCNARKGGRTPEEAGMKLRKRPIKPSTLPVTRALHLARTDMPQTWVPYCDTRSVERSA